MAATSAGRRTKIVATLGPASDSPAMIRQLIDAGVDVFRLNFSHGSHESHGKAIRDIRQAASEKSRPVAILQDLQGPKIRTGELADHQPVELVAGGKLTITTKPVIGNANAVSTTYSALPSDVQPGDTILLDDGRMQLTVLNVGEHEISTTVVVGGLLGEHKGIHVPGASLSAPCLTEKDLADLRFGVQAGVDYISLSFVRRAEDVERVREETRAAGRDIPIVAKIEQLQAIANLEAIVAAADAVMVARGDLGVETSSAEIPLLQKRILATSGRYAKPDITATQMLETMISQPRPSRAEATDVANAVFDGTDALMLSGETAVGRYPVEAVLTMSAIAIEAEKHIEEYGRPSLREVDAKSATMAEVTAHAACTAAREIAASAIAVFTLSGRTARLLAAQRMSIPVLAFTPHAETYRRLALVWGVVPIQSEFIENPDELAAMEDRRVRESGLVKGGDWVIMLAGSTAIPGATNTMRIHRVAADRGDTPPTQPSGET